MSAPMAWRTHAHRLQAALAHQDILPVQDAKLIDLLAPPAFQDQYLLASESMQGLEHDLI
jgi:hypothetical protein